MSTMIAIDSNSDSPESDLGQRLSESMADILCTSSQGAGFYLFLDSRQWLVRYYGVTGYDPAEIKGEAFEKWIAQNRSHHEKQLAAARDGGNPAAMHECLAGFARNFIDTRIKQMQLFEVRGAIGTLRNGFPLGFSAAISAWKLPGGGNDAPLLHTQKALTWKGLCGGDWKAYYQLLEMPRDSKGRSKSYYKVDNYTSEPGFVTADNYHMFIAEYLVFLDPAKQRPPLHQTGVKPLSFSLVPIRVLGQWRAALDWISAGTKIVPLKWLKWYEPVFMLEQLASTAVLEVFERRFRRVVQSSANSVAPIAQIAIECAFLWWAAAITFFKDGHCVARLARNEVGTLEAVKPVADPVADVEGFCVPRKAKSGGHIIPVDLTRLQMTSGAERAGGLEAEVLRKFVTVCGFDQIVYEVHLLDDASDKTFRRFEPLLKQCFDRMAKDIHAMGLRVDRSLSEGAYALGHKLKNRIPDITAPLNSAYDRIVRSSARAALDGNTQQGLEAAAKDIRTSLAEARRLEWLGIELDVMNRAIKGRFGPGSVREKPVWFDSKPLTLGDCFAHLGDDFSGRLNILSDASLVDSEIRGWLQPESGPVVRLAEFFYLHILSEVLLNARSHSGKKGAVDARVTLVLEGDEPMIVISNECVDRQNTLGILQEYVEGWQAGRWFPWAQFRAIGGVAYCNDFLRVTKAGSILFSAMEHRDGAFVFSVGIHIAGLAGPGVGSATK